MTDHTRGLGCRIQDVISPFFNLVPVIVVRTIGIQHIVSKFAEILEIVRRHLLHKLQGNGFHTLLLLYRTQRFVLVRICRGNRGVGSLVVLRFFITT